MKVSVCMIAYNHEKYIVQAVESALMQQTDFDYEIVVGEDCSTDKTRELLVGLQQRHPGRIRLLLPERNLGMMPNFIGTLQACRGQYIALLEGDDYWTHPHKLQKQVDFLDANPDYVICFHNARVVYEGVEGTPHVSNVNQKTISTVKDVIDHWFMTTASILFRREAMPPFPEWFAKVLNGDYALQLLLTYRGGKIYYLDETMAVYRRHSTGVYSWMKGNIYFNALIFLFRHFNRYSRFQYSRQVKKQLAYLCREMMKHNDRSTLAYWKAYYQYVRYKPYWSRSDVKIMIYKHVLPSFVRKAYARTKGAVHKP